MDIEDKLQDYMLGEKSFFEWQKAQHSTVDEYTLRKRRIELYALVNKVIENELCDTDRRLVRLHWYEDKSVSEISQLLDVDKTSVYRRINKITDIIYDKLKYAVEYHFGEDYSRHLHPTIKKGGSFFYAPPAESPGKRLKNLRLRHSLTIEQASKMSDIPLGRLWDIEQENTQPTAEDIGRLCKFYSESCDFVVFGERRRA